jgi:ubiquinone/menaquinone biosynthesis C-methylase UbiE
MSLKIARRGIAFVETRDPIMWHSETADEFAASYSKSSDKKERYQVWTKLIRQYSHEESDVIDLGCGNGIFSFYAAMLNRNVYGVDGSDKMISLCEAEKARQNIQNISFINSRIETLPRLLNVKADLIICSSLLEYLEDLSRSLEIVLDLLKRGGFVLISLPNKSSLYRKLEPFLFRFTGRPRYYACVKNVMTVEAMVEQLRNYGIKPLGYHFYGKTALLSLLFRKIGFARYSDNLIVFIGEKL